MLLMRGLHFRPTVLPHPVTPTVAALCGPTRCTAFKNLAHTVLGIFLTNAKQKGFSKIEMNVRILYVLSLSIVP